MSTNHPSTSLHPATLYTPTLPREVLRWLQSLDLSYSIKNVKRDFCNGYLIAEVLSKYYSSELSMYSFYTGVSGSSKQKNWELLTRFWSKHSKPEDSMGVNVHNRMSVDQLLQDAVDHETGNVYWNCVKHQPALVQGVQNALDGAAAEFVMQLYTLLTRRTLPSRPKWSLQTADSAAVRGGNVLATAADVNSPPYLKTTKSYTAHQTLMPSNQQWQAV